MKKIFGASLVFIFMIFCISPLVLRAEEKNTAPAFSLNDWNGQAVSLSDFKDKQEVVILFWASWCSFCRGEIKRLISRYPELKSKNIELLLINVEESPKTVKRFFSKDKVEFRVLLDRDGTAANDYNVVGIPTYVWIDKAGRIKYEGHTLPIEEGAK